MEVKILPGGALTLEPLEHDAPALTAYFAHTRLPCAFTPRQQQEREAAPGGGHGGSTPRGGHLDSITSAAAAEAGKQRAVEARYKVGGVVFTFHGWARRRVLMGIPGVRPGGVPCSW